MSDCVTSDAASIQLYCSDIECTENTCYTTVGATSRDYTMEQHHQDNASPASPEDEQNPQYDEPRALLEAIRSASVKQHM